MPAKRKKERIIGRYFTWLLGQRHGVWIADGRSSNPTGVGRHSLGTKDRQAALQQLVRLDAVRAVALGLAPRSILDTAPDDLLPLEEGQQLYSKYVSRPPVLGGATAKTSQRYRAVLQKFVRFAQDDCLGQVELVWLAEVVMALASTGLRISELADLRWADIDLDGNMVHLTDTRLHVRKGKRAAARTLKGHRDRSLPIHPELRRMLVAMRRHADGKIFHGPLGGRLKPDRVRLVLIREVLRPLADQFPAVAGEKGFTEGRLHSFRHYFCSASANSGVPEQVLMTWLGHRDSKMVRHYYHLHHDEAQRQMAKINFLGTYPEGETAG